MQLTSEEFNDALDEFCHVMNERDPGRRYEVSEGGTKFRRIYRSNAAASHSMNSQTVYCFVNTQTGEFHKAESWRKPVAKPKASLGTISAYNADAFDPYGSCFYAR